MAVTLIDAERLLETLTSICKGQLSAARMGCASWSSMPATTSYITKHDPAADRRQPD